MKKYKFENIDCPNCANEILRAILKLDCVKDARLSFATNTLYLDTTDLGAVLQTIKSKEKDAILLENDEEQKDSSARAPLLLVGLFLLSLCLYYLSDIAFLLSLVSSTTSFDFAHYAGIVGLVISYFLASKSIYIKALKNLKHFEIFDENFLMVVATIAAFALGMLSEAVAVMVFYSVGEFLQNLAVKKSKTNIKNLLSNSTPLAHLLDGEETKDIHPSLLNINDEIIIKLGEAVPIDGIITSGDGFFDTAMITGESIPQRFSKDMEIKAGYISLDSVIRLRVNKTYDQTSMYKIIELIELATIKKAKMENFITKFAKIYTPIIFAFALGVAVIPPMLDMGNFNQYAYKALVVLMVSCPCALVLSVPLGYFAGLGKASKEGILIKGANYLEALSDVTKIAFDKTGTLTLGSFNIIKVVPQNNISEEKLISLALRAEEHSNHPIAKSIKTYTKAKNINAQTCPCDDFDINEFAGLGIRINCIHQDIVAGNDAILHKFSIPHICEEIKGTVVHIASDKEYLGYLVIEDELKSDSKIAIDELKKLGVKEFAILSGDNEFAIQRVAEALGISNVYAKLLPEEKLRIFNQFKSKIAGNTAYVGDGTNDAPTLSSADVGIGLSKGSDISKQSSDVLLNTNSILSLANAIKIAKKTKKIIYQNIILALAVKIFFIFLGLEGYATLWEAVFGDVGVTLLAVLNTMRLLK